MNKPKRKLRQDKNWKIGRSQLNCFHYNWKTIRRQWQYCSCRNAAPEEYVEDNLFKLIIRREAQNFQHNLKSTPDYILPEW